MKEKYPEIEGKMNKVFDSMTREFSQIRAGRANASVLDKVFVDYYGTETPINQLASVSSPDARSLVIQPYDSSVLKSIEKSIQIADIGINPQNDGKVIRLIFPPLTEERRKEIVKDVHKMGEDAKVSIRSVRRDAIEKYKVDKKKSIITEDDLSIAEKDIQELTDKNIKAIEKSVAEKEKEVLEV